MPAIPLDAVDAFELAELLQFLSDWLKSDHDNLAASLTRFVGTPAYGPGTLHDDIARFRFLLGATDGEGLFTWTSRERAGVAATRSARCRKTNQAPRRTR